MMNAAPSAVLGVVLQVSETTPVSGTFDDLPGMPVGTLMLDLDDLSGLTLTFSSTRAVERLLDQVRAVHHGFIAADRKRQEDQAWAERRPDGRPLLRSVQTAGHPSLSGALR